MSISVIDEIKNRLDILEVIGSYIKLQKAGRNYKALCPFHSEKTPSFMVSPERQIWHCFGCGLGGDIFAFVKQIEGVEFGDALRTLARRAGVVLKRQDPAIQTQRRRLYETCELATKFFQKQLESKPGQRAYHYLLKQRGLKPETIKTWRLGWAPDEWYVLSTFLKQRGYTEEEIFSSGLSVKQEEKSEIRNPKSEINSEFKIQNSKFYDRFRSRIIFPLFDTQGQVVGFAGRIFVSPTNYESKRITNTESSVAKYINTPQTLLYDKSCLLYGLNFAKIELRQKNACILVEGNLDVIMSHQAGLKNVLASSGTALTVQHLKIIKRYTDNLLFAFDTDLAGETATKRSIDLALENDFNVKVVVMASKDPADLIKQGSSDWQKAIDEAVSLMDYYFATTFAKYSTKTAPEKRQIAKILLPVIRKIGNRIEQAHWLGQLAQKLKIDEKTLYLEMQKMKLPSPARGAQADGTVPPSGTSAWVKNGIAPIEKEEKSRTQGLEEKLLSLYLNYPEHLKSLAEQPQKIFLNQKLAQILDELKLAAEESSQKENCLQSLKQRLSPELLIQIDYLSLRIEQYPVEELAIIEEIERCLKELKIIKIKEKMVSLSFEIQEVQALGDKQKLGKNLAKFKNLSNQLTDLTR